MTREAEARKGEEAEEKEEEEVRGREGERVEKEGFCGKEEFVRPQEEGGGRAEEVGRMELVEAEMAEVVVVTAVVVIDCSGGDDNGSRFTSIFDFFLAGMPFVGQKHPFSNGINFPWRTSRSSIIRNLLGVIEAERSLILT